MESSPTPLPVDPIQKPKRPTYLALLAGYLAIYGGVMFVLQLLAYTNLKTTAESLGYDPLILLVAIIFSGVVSIAAGVGLWLGKKWGWWLSAFYFLYMFAQEITALFASGSLPSSGGAALLNAAIGILLSIVVVYYLFKNEQLAHFHLETFPRWKSMLILVAAVLAASLLI